MALTTQGHKQVLLGEKVFAYGPGESKLTTIDVPVAAHTTRLTTREIYLGHQETLSARMTAGAPR